MKKYIIFLLILLSQISYSQWEKTSWNSDKAIMNFYAKDSIIFIISDEVKISTDYGKNWNKIENPIIDTIPYAKITIGNNLILMYDHYKLYLSKDFAKSWQLINEHIKFGNIRSIMIFDNKIYVGTSNFGVFVSSDLGVSWQNIINFSNKYTCELFNFNNKIIAINEDSVYYSNDLGQNWFANPNTLPKIYSNDPNIVICGNNIVVGTNEDTYNGGINKIYISSDIGQTWIEKNNEKIKKSYIYTLASVDNSLFISKGDSLFFSNDLGDTWTNIKKDFPIVSFGSAFYSVADTVYLHAGYYVYVSYNKGLEWQRYSNPVIYSYVNFMKNKNKTLYILSDYYYGIDSYPFMLYTSIDKGDTWIGKGFMDTLIYSVDIYDNNVLLSTENGIFLSKNSLLTYNKIYDCEYSSLSILNNNTIIMYNSQKLLVSNDLGETWIDKSSSMPNNQYPICFAFYNDYIIMGTECCIYISSDKGDTWIEKNNGLPSSLLYPSIIKFFNNEIYIGTDFGLFSTNDLGDTWISYNSGFSDNYQPIINSFVLYQNNIFVSIEDQGILFSKDYGNTWKKVNDGISNKDGKYFTNSLEIIDDYIFTSTIIMKYGINGDAIYRAKLSDFGISSVNNSQEEENNISIFPNPATNQININYRIDNTCSPILKIYNIVGQIVYEKQFNIHYPDNYTKTIVLNNISDGIYILEITQDNTKTFNKITVVH